jgi:hypothetical protein
MKVKNRIFQLGKVYVDFFCFPMYEPISIILSYPHSTLILQIGLKISEVFPFNISANDKISISF